MISIFRALVYSRVLYNLPESTSLSFTGTFFYNCILRRVAI